MELKDTREIDSYFTYDGSRAHKFSADKFVTESTTESFFEFI